MRGGDGGLARGRQWVVELLDDDDNDDEEEENKSKIIIIYILMSQRGFKFGMFRYDISINVIAPKSLSFPTSSGEQDFTL